MQSQLLEQRTFNTLSGHPGVHVLIPVGRPADQSFPSPCEDTHPTLLVGPEGGWSESEFQYLQQAGARVVSIGPMTYRAETVPAAALSLIHFLSASAAS